MSPTSIARGGEPLVFQLISCTFYVEEPLPPCSSDKDVGGDELKRGLHLFQENSERLEFSFTVFLCNALFNAHLVGAPYGVDPLIIDSQPCHGITAKL